MIASMPSPKSSRASQFSCLKPCQPGPGIASAHICCIDEPRGNRASRQPPKSATSPTQESRRTKPWLTALFATAQVAALGLGIGLPLRFPGKVSRIALTEPAQPTQLSLISEDTYQRYLGAKAQQLESELAKAEHNRLAAQQLRLEAEAEGQNLTDAAQQQAKETTKAAMRRADLIRLDATYIGAEQVLYAAPGTDISLKFAARIQCKDGTFGQTAVASPVDARIAPRQVRNLKECYPSSLTPTGQPIGKAGTWGVAFFKQA